VIVEVIVSYIAGSIVGFWLFKQMTTERTIAATLDNLVDEGYIRTRVDDEGITQLYKYDEKPNVKITFEDVDELMNMDDDELPNIKITFDDVEELMDMDEDELARRIEEVLEEDDDEEDEPPRGTV